MASKKESEDIVLLSMYGDKDDDDMEQDDSGNEAVLVENKEQGEVTTWYVVNCVFLELFFY